MGEKEQNPKLKKLIGRILPYGSKRRTLAGIIVRGLKQPRLFLRILNLTRLKRGVGILRKEGIGGLLQHYQNAETTEKAFMSPCPSAGVNVMKESVDIFDNYDEISFVKQNVPQVSIIIPVYNQFDYTYKCLYSILKNSGNISYEVIIADDRSTDETQRIEEKVHNIIRISNKKNLRFLKNCNHAATYAKGKYILFLNNDTQVQKDWLQPMVSLMNKFDEIGIVGAKLVYEDGWLQEAGGIVWNDATVWNYGNRRNPENAEYNYVKDVDFVSGACVMIRKELWQEIGGFDEVFAPAYYEDVDLAFEVRKRGYRVVYQPQSAVVHFEGISNGKDTKTGQKAYQLVNREKFYDKWKETLKKENLPKSENLFLARDRSWSKKHILVVDHYVPHFDKDAGGRGTFMYLKLFVEIGLKVTFIGDNFFKHEPYTTMLNQEEIEILYGAEYMQNFKQWIKDNGRYFDYVYLQRPHISIKYIDLVKEYTNAKIIYYDVDLCHLREMRQYNITKDEALLHSAKKWKEIEFGLIKKADVVHVVGSYEKEYLEREFPNKPIRNIPLYIYSDVKRNVVKDFIARKNLLFVGGFGHPPNEDGVIWFANNIFPGILKIYPDIKWYIVGSNPTEKVQELSNENIIVKGFVSDEELEQLYSQCRLAIVPLRYGAGVKGKVLEAIYNQIPLVTTSIGAEGLSKEEDAYWVEDDEEKMIELIIRIYNNQEDLLEKSDNCKQFILNHFTISEAKRILELDI